MRINAFVHSFNRLSFIGSFVFCLVIRSFVYLPFTVVVKFVIASKSHKSTKGNTKREENLRRGVNPNLQMNIRKQPLAIVPRLIKVNFSWEMTDDLDLQTFKIHSNS